jgi:outer membrane protein
MQKIVVVLFSLIMIMASVVRAQQVSGNVAFADVEYILAMLPETKQLEEELKSTQTKLQGDFETRQKQFQKVYQDYAANMKTMTDTARASAEQQLRTMNAEIQQFPQDAQATLENTRKLRMAPVYLKVGRAIDAVATENGYSLIIPIRISGMELILYGDEAKNVSKLVLQKLGVTPAPAEKKQ